MWLYWLITEFFVKCFSVSLFGLVLCKGHVASFSFCCSWIFFFFREVFKAKHRQTGKKVALKKVLMENEKEGVSVGRGWVWPVVTWAAKTHGSSEGTEL